MFSDLEALDFVLHRDLGLLPGNGFDFARSTMTAPLSASEMTNAARLYPVVFPLDSVIPQALMSLEAGKNLFVRADGTWAADYIPAHLRRWPFILQDATPGEAAPVLFDRSAPSLKKGKGERLFTDAGELSPRMKQIVDFLARLQAEGDYTASLLAPLEEVLVERRIEIERPGSGLQVLKGFRAVDAEKFSALPGETILEWRASGVLPLVYAHLLSMGNVPKLADMQARNQRGWKKK